MEILKSLLLILSILSLLELGLPSNYLKLTRVSIKVLGLEYAVKKTRGLTYRHTDNEVIL